MAKIGDIEIKVEFEKFITDTRINSCTVLNCEHRSNNWGCRFKEIDLDENGRCNNFENKENAPCKS